MDNTARISDMFGKDSELLAWILQDSLARTAAILSNLCERDRQFLYRYCVLNQSLLEIEQYFRANRSFDPVGSELDSLQEQMEMVRDAIIANAPILLDSYRKRRKAGRLR